MTRALIRLFALLTGAACLAQGPLARQPPARWSEREEAFFGNALIDVRRHTAALNGRMIGVIDCSTPTTLCLDATEFKIELPAICSSDAETGMRAAGARVLGSFRSWDEHLDPVGKIVFVVMHPRFPQIVYEYTPTEGIIGLSYRRLDGTGEDIAVDFAEAVTAGRYVARRHRDWSWSARISLDPFGACRPPGDPDQQR